jgi:hypothetical protein
MLFFLVLQYFYFMDEVSGVIWDLGTFFFVSFMLFFILIDDF